MVEPLDTTQTQLEPAGAVTPEPAQISPAMEEQAPQPNEYAEVNIEGRYREIRLNREFEAARRRLELRRQTKKEAPAEPQEPGQAAREAALGRLKIAGKTALGIGHTIIETPIQAPGGVLDYANSALQAFSELADWLDENVVDLGKMTYSAETGLKFTSAKRAKKMAKERGLERVEPFQLPVPAEAGSVGGGIIRNISRFLTGFVGAGKFLRLGKAITRAGQVGQATLKGAVSDVTAWREGEERLSDLIQSVPALENPITEYLATDPEDTAAERHFKDVLEGMGLGVATDALIQGLRVVRAGRLAQAAAKAEEAVPARIAEETAEAAQLPLRVIKRGEIEALLSDRPVRRTAELREVEGITPEKVAAAGIETPRITVEKGKIFANWDKVDSADDLKPLMRDLADLEAGAIKAEQRGVQTWEQTVLNAEQEDAFQILVERQKGQPLGDAKMRRLKELWVSSTARVKHLAQEAIANPSVENQFAFRKMVSIQNVVQRQFYGAQTELARSLQALRIPVGGDLELTRSLGTMLEHLGGDQTTMAMAEKIVQLTRAGAEREIDAFIQTSAWSRSRDAISAAWYFSLLSGLRTQMRNLTGNTVVLANEVAERKIANLIGQALGDPSVADGEALAMLSGTIEGSKDALRISSRGRRILREATEVAFLAPEGRELARQMLRHGQEEFGTVYRAAVTGETGMGVGKLEIPVSGAFSSERWMLDPESGWGRSMDMLDSLVSVPGRALVTGDELFKTIGYRAELHAQTHRKVMQEIRSGTLENTPENIKNRTVELLANPDETTRLAATDAAAYRTFTQQMGPWAKGLNDFLQSSKNPLLRGLGKVYYPFRRTPANLYKYGFERTPFAPLFEHVRADMAAGGARRDIALARMAMGSTALLAAMDLAMSGDITGMGPVNPAQRATLRRLGQKPNSFKLGDRWYSYRGTEPISQTLGLAANIVEILVNTDTEDPDLDMEKAIVATVMSIAHQMTSAQYMSGISDFVEALGDPARYGESVVQRFAGSLVPTGLAQVTQAIDPNMRAVSGMLDAIRRRTPGLSDDLPFRRDAWGRPISYQSGIGTWYDVISPFMAGQKVKPEPIDLELEKLELWIGKPTARVSFSPDMMPEIPFSGSVSVDLRRYPKAYDRYVELQGNALTHIDGIPVDISNTGLLNTLNALVIGKHPLSQQYALGRGGSDGQKAEMIRSMRNKFMRAARKQLLREFPELRQEVISRMPRDWISQ